MLPAEKYNKVMKFIRTLGYICGADVLDPNYHYNFVTVFLYICIGIYFVFNVYTINLKFSEGWGVLLESFCMIGTVTQGFTKLTSAICFCKDCCQINVFLLGLYTKYQDKNNKYVDVLNKCITDVEKFLKYFLVVYIMIFSTIMVVPFLFHMHTGRRYLPFHFYIPGLDLKTDFGYYMTYVFHSVCLTFAGFGNFAGDIFILGCNAHIVIFVEILKLKISELNEMAEDNLDAGQTKRQLIDIVDWHQTYSGFAETCEKVFFWGVFMQVTTSAISIVFTLFLLITGDWPGSYPYLVLEFATLYFYCGMGTVMEISNDKFCDEIYNASWYNLPIAQQKIILLMLMKSQDPTLLTVGGVAPLSVSTGLQVTKSVYSIMMMILNFVEQKKV